MSTETNTQPAKSSTRKFALPVVIAIIVIGAIGYVTSKAGLDKALVKEAVDNFAANVKQSSNGTLAFSYDDIKIAGGFTDRHAIITEPTLTQTANEEQILTFTTEKILVHPSSRDLSSLTLELPHALKAFKSEDSAEKPTLTIIPKTAIKVDVSEKTIGTRAFVHSHIALPESMLIDGPEAERGKPWNQFDATLKAGGSITTSFTTDADAPTGLGDTVVNVRSLVLTPQHEPADTITIDTVSSHYSNQQNDKAISTVSLNTDIGPITANSKVLPYGAMEVSIEGVFEGLLSNAPADFAEGGSNEKSLKLKTFTLKTEKAALYANADFVSGAKDVLPVGTANITLENATFVFDELKRHKLLKSSDEAIMQQLVQQITGKALGAEKDLSIDITRVRDGAFQIGNTTFEELMALVLRGALTPQNFAPSAGEMPKGLKAPENQKRETVKEPKTE